MDLSRISGDILEMPERQNFISGGVLSVKEHQNVVDSFTLIGYKATLKIFKKITSVKEWFMTNMYTCYDFR